MVAYFWLKLDTWPRYAILDLQFIGRRPLQVTSRQTCRERLVTNEKAIDRFFSNLDLF